MKKLSIQVLIGIALFLFENRQLHAQTCCPYIDSYEIIPANPTYPVQVKLAVQVTVTSMGNFISSSVSFPTQYDIEGSLCYYAGMLPALQTYHDTLDLGVLAAGVYSFQLRATQTPDQLNCSMGSLNDTAFSFTVLPLVGLENKTMEKNPQRFVTNDLNPVLTGRFNEEPVRLLNSLGQEIFSGPLPLPVNLNPGFFVVEPLNTKGNSTRIFWLKPH